MNTIIRTLESFQARLTFVHPEMRRGVQHISIEHNISDPPHLILISQTHFGQGRVLLNI